MRYLRSFATLGACVLILTSPACGGSVAPAAPVAAPMPASEAAETPDAPTAAPDAPTAAPEPTAEPEATEAPVLEAFSASNFDQSTVIDNPWLPLVPGVRYVYEGSTLRDDGKLVPHRIEVHVTDLAKEIDGVRSLTTWDLDYSEDVLAEAELAFYAQDKDGNVWRMGEYPEVYEEGKVVEAPTWIHGFQDAQAGIMMQADPQPDTPSYAQGWGPAVNWTDRGQVDKIGQSTCVLVDCYDDVLIIAETSQAEPDAQQLKYYARGVGNVRVGFRGEGEKTKETLELTRMERLSPEELAEVRAKALALEKSAYENSKDVYALTPAMVQLTPEN